jgi:hypothetical protein
LDDWLAYVSVFLWLVAPIVIFISRHWIIARISQGVQHHFNREIEKLRADLRKSEEQYKSGLRDSEAEMAALRNSVLSGSAGRQALLDKRRFEAVERVWTAVDDLAELKALSGTMAILNYKAIAREANTPKMQQFLSIIGSTAPDIKQIKNVARGEQPFLPELAWAYFWAYRSILYLNYGRYVMLKTGVSKDDDPEKFLSIEGVKKILKAVLPHQSKFIDENDPGAYHYLLDEIEARLLAELRKILEGKDADQADAARAKEILGAVKAVDKERAEQAIPKL